MPTDSKVLQPDGKMDLSWRSFFQSAFNKNIGRKEQTITNGAKIKIVNQLDQLIPIGASGSVTTDTIALDGKVLDGSRITLACTSGGVTIKESDTDGGCVMGGDVILAPKETLELIYSEVLKRFLIV